MATKVEEKCAKELRKIADYVDLGTRGREGEIQVAGELAGVYVALMRSYGMTLHNMLQTVEESASSEG